MRSGKEIQAEIAQVEAELEQARAELEKMQSQANEYEKAQNDDPEWAIARRNYIDTGDMSGVNSWYSRYDQRKRDAFNQKIQEEQLALSRMEAEKDKRDSLSKLAREVDYAAEEYNDALNTYARKMGVTVDNLDVNDLDFNDKFVIDGLLKKYNRAIDTYEDVGESGKFRKASKHGLIGAAPASAPAPAPKQEPAKEPAVVPAEGSVKPQPEVKPQGKPEGDTEGKSKENLYKHVKSKSYASGSISKQEKDEAIKNLEDALTDVPANAPWVNDAQKLLGDIRGMKTKEQAKKEWNDAEAAWLSRVQGAGRQKASMLNEAQAAGHLKGYKIVEGKLTK